MFRHVYSNADIQMPTSASLDMFGHVYSNTNIQMPEILEQKLHIQEMSFKMQMSYFLHNVILDMFLNRNVIHNKICF